MFAQFVLYICRVYSQYLVKVFLRKLIIVLHFSAAFRASIKFDITTQAPYFVNKVWSPARIKIKDKSETTNDTIHKEILTAELQSVSPSAAPYVRRTIRSQKRRTGNVCMYVFHYLESIKQIVQQWWLIKTPHADQKWRHELALYLSLLQSYMYRARFILNSGEHEVLRFIQLNI